MPGPATADQPFSKEKPVFTQPRLNSIFLMYPPYGKTFERMLALLKRIA
jgi:coniferyl-aldehyde dehydrogenase